MKQSLRYIIIILAFGLVVSILADWFLQRGFEKSNDDVIGKLNELLIDTTYYDILCFGSSRTLAHINPAIIEKETGLSTYNAGLNGGCVIDFNALFKVYLTKHPTPKMLVIHVDEFTFETETISEFSRYFPFINNDILYENLVKYNKTFLVIKYVRFLRLMYYFDLLKWISLKSWLNIGARDEYRLIKGYRENKSQWNSYREEHLDERLKNVKAMVTVEAEEKEGEKLFQEMLDLCKQHNIKLVFTSSPELGGVYNRKYKNAVQKFEKLAIGYQASFLWMHEEEWDREKYFYDFTHMNNLGADQYSHALATFINKHK